MRLDLGDHGVDACAVRHVSLNGEGAIAQFRRQGLGAFSAAAPVDRHPRALARKGPRRRRAHAARPAGDENDLIADFHENNSQLLNRPQP